MYLTPLARQAHEEKCMRIILTRPPDEALDILLAYEAHFRQEGLIDIDDRGKMAKEQADIFLRYAEGFVEEAGA